MKKIYILPNLFTSGNLFCGVLAMCLVFEGHYIIAAIVILAGLILDFCDGVVARLQRTTSRFGLEYDSLADLVTFGIAPMAMLYKLHVTEAGGDWRTGLGMAFLYVACTALRLARFNVQVHDVRKVEFCGLPSPFAAGALASLVIALHRHTGLGKEGVVLPAQTHFLILATLPLGFLMVSTLRYPALARMLRPPAKKPFVHLVAISLVLGAMMFFIEGAVFFCFAAYAASGPVLACYRAIAHKPAVERELHPVQIARFGRFPKRRRRRRSRARGDFPTQQGNR